MLVIENDACESYKDTWNVMLSTLYYVDTKIARHKVWLKRCRNYRSPICTDTDTIDQYFSFSPLCWELLKISFKITTMPYLFPYYDSQRVESPIEYNQCLFCNFVDIFSTINLPPGIISIELKLSVLAVAAGAFQLTNDDRMDQRLPWCLVLLCYLPCRADR